MYLQDLYEKYGYYKERSGIIVLEGMAGAARISRMMEGPAQIPRKEFGKVAVKRRIDYKDDIRILTNQCSEIHS